MRKKFFLLLLSLFFSIILIGCSNNTEIEKSNNNNIESEKNSNDEKDNNNDEKDKSIIQEESIENKKVRLFYFDTVTYELYYVDKEIEVKDKAIIKSLTKELQEYSPNKDFLNLTDKVDITRATLDEDNKTLKIVFSSSYVDEMLLGSSTESGLLASLLATYGYNSNANKISIYFQDELYTSLKGDLPNGYFDVDYSSAIPYSEKRNINDSSTPPSEKKNINDSSTPPSEEKNINDSSTPPSEEKNINDSSAPSKNIKNISGRIYYYDVNEDMYYYKDKNIEVIDSALVTALTKEINNPPNKRFFNYGNDLSVRSAKLNGDTLTVDLSSSYYNILTRLGSGPEASALKILALTYGYNYNVDKVIILINGQPYKSGHITFEANQPIDTKVSNIKELN